MSEPTPLPPRVPSAEPASFAPALSGWSLPGGDGVAGLAAPGRQRHIRLAREAILFSDASTPGEALGVEGWIARSWRRCLAQGQRPEHAPVFNALPVQQLRRTLDANRQLLQAAAPVLDKLSQAIADSRYFAVLTNHDGVVVGASAAINRSDPRARLIARVGTDLSEAALGTTAISAALAELQPVWLHRGEHFFDANSDLSCAGAPLFGPNGRCVGMLDLTGVQTDERPELRHLVSRFARHIENALTLGQLSALTAPQRASSVLLRLNWAGCALGGDNDGLIGLDGDGFVLGANQAARHMVPPLQPSANPTAAPVHCSDLFAMPFEMLFDAARASGAGSAPALDVPLWSGLRLHVAALRADAEKAPPVPPHRPHPLHPLVQANAAPQPLREVETALIRQAVVNARGNVVQAAKALGVSRATVYRRLGKSSQVR